MLFALIGLIGALVLSAAAFAEGGGTGDGILNVPADYSTIAAALANANSGDKINIAAGTYYEGDLVVDKQLIIRGAGSGSTTIDSSGANSDYGILLAAGGISATRRLIIKDLSVTNSPLRGIRAYKADGLNLD